MHFCSIAMNWIQDILEENSSWQIYKLMEGHSVCPIKDLDLSISIWCIVGFYPAM